MGETFAACLAGDCAAINTVMIPMATPQRIPLILTENSGISTHSPFTINFSIRHDTLSLLGASSNESVNELYPLVIACFVIILIAGIFMISSGLSFS